MPSDSVLRIHLPGLLLLLSLLISVGFFSFVPPERVERTLLFPRMRGSTLAGEERLVPRVGERSREVTLLVEELLLGPTRITNRRALPRSTRIDSAILVDDTFYLDLSAEAILSEEQTEIDVTMGLAAIEETLRYNFRWLDQVVITMDGNVPFSPAYRPIGP